jgi:hypothetical protein
MTKILIDDDQEDARTVIRLILRKRVTAPTPRKDR